MTIYVSYQYLCKYLEIALVGEGLGTDLAGVLLLLVVDPHVRHQVVVPGELFLAHVTRVRPVCAVLL